MTVARATQVNPDATSYYHCISRCVRRAYLMGNDRYTGRNFDHRKRWVVRELARLERIFAIDICAYAIMSNHMHLVVCLRLEQARPWSAAEVIARARQLFPLAVRKAEARSVSDEQVEEYRTRLSSLSWFMRCLNERIARRANREDNCTGRFWEGRFKSGALLDLGAVLTCMSYVDLNPVRAGVDSDPVDSRYTSLAARLLGRPDQNGAHDEPSSARDSDTPALVPFEDDIDTRVDADTRAAADKRSRPLPFTLDAYVQALRAVSTAQQPDGPPLARASAEALRALRLDDEAWVRSVSDFGRWKLAAVGESHRMSDEAKRRGVARLNGTTWARTAYRAA